MIDRSDTAKTTRTKKRGSKKSVIQRVNDWLVSKITKRKKYASVSYRYLSKNIEKELCDAPIGAKQIAVTFTNNLRPATELTMFLGFSLTNELSVRVLLVDTVIKPNEDSLSEKLGLTDNEGFLQVSSGALSADNIPELIKKTAVDSVDILPSGASENSSSIVLRKSAIKEFLAQIGSKYDYIIYLQDDIRVDTRYMHISNIVLLNLLVVEENRSYMHDVEESKKRYHESDLENLRLIMTT